MIREFQPRKRSFIAQRVMAVLILGVFLSVGVAVAAFAAGEPALMALIPVLLLLLPVPVVVGALVSFRKERYELHATHLVCRHGGLLSDGRTELELRNITHLRLRLPWLRHKLFGIGDVRVESAGSSDAEITFQSVVEPEKLFEHIQELMRGQGYSLKGGAVLHEESPGVVGAVTDVVRLAGVVFGALALTIGSYGPDLAEEMSSGVGIGAVVGVLAAVSVLLGVLLIGGLTIRYLDLRRRTYTVREDMVLYTEGFLTRDNAVIPFENLADANTTRSFTDRLLGLYDVRVSCQGAGSEIVFRRLSGGEEIKAAIARLVSSAGAQARMQEQSAPQVASGASGEAAHTPATSRSVGRPRPQVAAEDVWTATLQMHMLRSIVAVTPAILMPPAWLLVAGMAALRAARTEFQVGADTLSQHYSLFSSSTTQFAYDKVTGVQVTRTPIDKMFGTVSVEVWSIGAPQPIRMNYISEQDLNLDALLRQCGIPKSAEPPVVLPQSYGLKAAVISLAPGLAFFALCLLGLVVGAVFASPFVLLAVPVLVAMPAVRFVWNRLRIQRQAFRLYPEHFEAETGIWFRRQTFARFSDVKRLESVRLPLTRQGHLSLFVAGERVIQTQNGESRIPNVVRVAFLDDMDRLVDALDAFMLDRISASDVRGYAAPPTTGIAEVGPSLAASGAGLALIGMLFPPLWLLLPFILWQAHVRRFVVEADRLVQRDGIFFKRVTSIAFHKLDSIQQVQGAVGKAFKTGKITLLTAGSSRPDLVLAHIPNHDELYGVIRAYYKPQGG